MPKKFLFIGLGMAVLATAALAQEELPAPKVPPKCGGEKLALSTSELLEQIQASIATGSTAPLDQVPVQKQNMAGAKQISTSAATPPAAKTRKQMTRRQAAPHKAKQGAAKSRKKHRARVGFY